MGEIMKLVRVWGRQKLEIRHHTNMRAEFLYLTLTQILKKGLAINSSRMLESLVHHNWDMTDLFEVSDGNAVGQQKRPRPKLGHSQGQERKQQPSTES